MSRLFSLDTNLPDIPGLSYLPNYVSECDEHELIAAIDAEGWDETWKRRRQIYGEPYGRSSHAPRPLPVWSHALISRLHADRICERRFDQMVVNEYLPGQGISLHRDYEPFGRTVVSLSLLSSCVMDFRRIDDNMREALLLSPRSLLIISDEARYEWEHGIAPRKTDRWDGIRIARQRRVSVTLRQRVH